MLDTYDGSAQARTADKMIAHVAWQGMIDATQEGVDAVTLNLSVLEACL